MSGNRKIAWWVFFIAIVINTLIGNEHGAILLVALLLLTMLGEYYTFLHVYAKVLEENKKAEGKKL